MERSIQEYLKKINSKLTLYDCLGIFAVIAVLGTSILYFFLQAHSSSQEVSYRVGSSDTSKMVEIASSKPFASRSGKTYTFSWCRGQERIAEKNKIYFASEIDAKNSGRVLSKLCQ